MPVAEPIREQIAPDRAAVVQASDFRLERYFAAASLAAFFLVAVPLLFLEHQEREFFRQAAQEQSAFFMQAQQRYAGQYDAIARRDLLAMREAGNVNLARLFVHTLWEKDIAPIVAGAQKFPADHCRGIADDGDARGKIAQPDRKRACFAGIGRKIMALPGFGALDARVFQAMRNSTAARIGVYDLRGIAVYSSEHGRIGEDKFGDPGWLSAAAGKSASEFTHRDRVAAFRGPAGDRDLIFSFVPVLAPGSGKILGVLEVYSDETPFLEQIRNTASGVQALSAANYAAAEREALGSQDRADERASLLLASILGLLALLYCALFLIVRRGQRIIDNQGIARRQAEIVLRQVEERFRDLVDSTDGIVWEADAVTFTFSFVSNNAERILGYPAAAWLEPGFWAGRIHSEDREGAVQYCVSCTGQLADHEFEYRFIAADGRVVWLRDIVKVVEAGGKPRLLRGLMIDVTERKQVDELLEENREKYRGLSEGAFEAIFISENGRCLEQNRRAEELFGYSTEEAVGRLGTEWIVPEDRERVMKNMIGGYELPYEVTGLRKDGSTFPAIIRGKMMRFKGRTVRATSMSDISERKRAAAALRRSEANLRAIADNATFGIAVIQDGRRVFANKEAAALPGYSVEEFARLSILDVVHPDDRERLLGLQRRRLAGESVPHKVEFTVLARDGRVIPTEGNFAMTTWDEKPAVMLFSADITERRQAEMDRTDLEAQLRQSQKMEAIGTLAGGIAHDFNNIIVAILGNVDLARQDAISNPLVLASLDEIRKAAARARDLVQQILSVSRRQPTERRLTALTPVVEESVRLLRASLPARLALNVHCAGDVPAVLADATQIQQIIINLVTNAMQAMPDVSGRIDIRLDTMLLDATCANAHPALRALFEKHPGRTVRLAVSDDGPGMDTATVGRIFEPFFTTKPVGEGTGLGLSVVHGIVQTHEGAIEVDSQLGGGSTFVLYLPVAAGAGAAAPDLAPAPATAAGADGGQHILYVDDDEALVYLVHRLLQRRGYHLSAHTGQAEALAALRADPAGFDLVVTDYNMPGMSGLDVARAVREIRADLPVAVASGFIDEALRAQASEAGVRELIFKANAAEDLCEAIARLARAVWEESRPGREACRKVVPDQSGEEP